jgi:LPXTG-motif cell wall-anchored protein
MKATKFAVLGATVLGMISVFLDWISVSGKSGAILDALPRTGMDNGGPVFLFFFILALIGSGIGVLKRYGRGLAVLTLIGGLLSAFMGLVKYADIEAAAKEATKIGATVDAGMGYWLFFTCSCAIVVLSIVNLIKPEKKEPAVPRMVGAGMAHSP